MTTSQQQVHPELIIRDNLADSYPDIYTTEAIAVMASLARFNADQKRLMEKRIERRLARIEKRRRISFLNPEDRIPGTDLSVQEAREGKFVGATIPADLQRQWIQGTGPAARPDAETATSIRNVAYALLSGADGWMFDGEDALGQISTMSLENQRNLKLAIRKDPVFMEIAEQVANEMNQWGQGFFGREIIDDWQQQLDFTTKIFRALVLFVLEITAPTLDTVIPYRSAISLYGSSYSSESKRISRLRARISFHRKPFTS